MEPFSSTEGEPDKYKQKLSELAHEGEPEELLELIRDFLASNDGRETCPDYRETLETFFRRIADFLNTAYISHHDTKGLTACFEALFALFHAIPYDTFSHINISPLSKPLSHLARIDQDGNISMQAQARCLFALYKQLSVTSGLPFAPSGERSQSTHSHMTCLRRLSLEADKALQQVDTTRQNLEDDLVGFEQGRVDKGCVSESLTAHLHAMTCGSRAIVAWLRHQDADDEVAKDVLGDWSSYMTRIRKIVGSNSSLKGEDLLSVSYHNIPYLNGGTWSIIALAIMGYMRHTNVYPLLADLPHCNSLEFWCPFLKEADKRWISGSFSRELLPMASALNVLVQNEGTTVQVRDLSLCTSYDMMGILRYPVIDSPPNLSTMGFPFSFLASIDCSRGYEIQGLFYLVSVLHSFHSSGWSVQEVQAVVGPIIGEALQILKKQFGDNRSKEPLLFSFSVLQKLFSWEREGNIFPFSDENMDYIVNIIFRSVLENQDLIILLDSDCADMIASLEGVCGDAHSGFGATDDDSLTSIDLRMILPFDLRCLFDASVKSETLTAQKNQANMSLPARPRVPKFLQEKSYRRLDARDKDDICFHVIGWRKQ